MSEAPQRVDEHQDLTEQEAAHLKRQRERLLHELRVRPELRESSALDALAAVPREMFVSRALREHAYANRALPIEHEQTISQPYIVALMTDRAQIGPGARVLEVGTGCGYQAAVLAAMGAEVFTIEIIEPLAREAKERLERLGLKVRTRVGDGHQGWPEQAPFDAILVTAAPREVPQALIDQLAVGGRLVMPVGGEEQELVVIRRTERGFSIEQAGAVRFVPMTGGQGASFVNPQVFDRI